LLQGYKPVQHVTVLNTVGNCNTEILYYNLMGPPSCMRSVVNRNVVMRRIPVRICWSVTWVDTRTLNKMAAQWSRIKTLHGLQKMVSGSRQNSLNYALLHDWCQCLIEKFSLTRSETNGC